MTVPPEDVVLGVTHLRINGELVKLYKCPFCPFKNIHEDEITRHIRYKDNAEHYDVDVDKLDKNLYKVIVRKSKSHFVYVKKEDLPLPSIKCLWCPYEDKIVRDLEWHFLEKHKDRLYQMKAPLEERKRDPVWMWKMKRTERKNYYGKMLKPQLSLK